MGYKGHSSVSKHDGSNKDSWYSYICGHCDTKVSGAVVCGYYEAHEHPIKWLLCPNCGNGSVLAKDGKIYPGVPFGPLTLKEYQQMYLKHTKRREIVCP